LLLAIPEGIGDGEGDYQKGVDRRAKEKPKKLNVSGRNGPSVHHLK